MSACGFKCGVGIPADSLESGVNIPADGSNTGNRMFPPPFEGKMFSQMFANTHKKRRFIVIFNLTLMDRIDRIF